MAEKNQGDPAQPQEAPKEIGSTYDLTDFQSPPFVYKLRRMDEAGNPTNDVQVIRVDYEMSAMELQSRIPTVLAPYTEMPDGEGGTRMVTGWEYLWTECFKKGKPIPQDLPSIPHILDAITKAMQIPPNHSMSVKLAVFKSWVTETIHRAHVKKGGPRSQEQPEPSPA